MFWMDMKFWGTVSLTESPKESKGASGLPDRLPVPWPEFVCTLCDPRMWLFLHKSNNFAPYFRYIKAARRWSPFIPHLHSVKHIQLVCYLLMHSLKDTYLHGGTYIKLLPNGKIWLQTICHPRAEISSEYAGCFLRVTLQWIWKHEAGEWEVGGAEGKNSGECSLGNLPYHTPVI